MRRTVVSPKEVGPERVRSGVALSHPTIKGQESLSVLRKSEMRDAP